MDFSLVLISLLGVVGIDRCWGDLTKEEMIEAGECFSAVLEAFDKFITDITEPPDNGQTSNRKETYDNKLESTIESGEEAFKKLTISSLEECVNILKETNDVNDKDNVFYELQHLYVEEMKGTQEGFNNNC